MARLFTCGFEESTVAADLLTTMWTATNGTAPTIQASTPHSGSNRMETGGTASGIQRNFSSLITSGTLFTRFYFKATDATVSAETYVFRWLSNVPAAGSAIFLTTAGKLKLTNEVGAQTQTMTTVLADNTWYRIEHRLVVSDTVGETQLRLYDDAGTLLEDIQVGALDQDTLPGNLQTPRFGKTASTSVFSYDDIAINDDTDPGDGSQMTWPGPGKIYMLVPDSDVSVTWEDDDGVAVSTFANIDDLPGTPDDTNYNQEDDTFAITDRFGLTNLGAEVPSDATLNVFDVYARLGSNQTSSAILRFNYWDESGTLHPGTANVSCNVNGWKIRGTGEFGAWNITGKTKANLDSWNVGYINVTDVATRPRRISALWVNVEWTESGGLTTAQTIPAFQFPSAMIGRRYV